MPDTDPPLDYFTPGSGRLVRLERFSSSFEADLAAARLNAEGITAVVAGGHVHHAGAVAGGGFGVELLVPADQLDEARALLATIRTLASSTPHDPPTSDESFPSDESFLSDESSSSDDSPGSEDFLGVDDASRTVDASRAEDDTRPARPRILIAVYALAGLFVLILLARFLGFVVTRD